MRKSPSRKWWRQTRYKARLSLIPVWSMLLWTRDQGDHVYQVAGAEWHSIDTRRGWEEAKDGGKTFWGCVRRTMAAQSASPLVHVHSASTSLRATSDFLAWPLWRTLMRPWVVTWGAADSQRLQRAETPWLLSIPMYLPNADQVRDVGWEPWRPNKDRKDERTSWLEEFIFEVKALGLPSYFGGSFSFPETHGLSRVGSPSSGWIAELSSLSPWVSDLKGGCTGCLCY